MNALALVAPKLRGDKPRNEPRLRRRADIAARNGARRSGGKRPKLWHS